MWGQYPAVVPQEPTESTVATVRGMAFFTRSPTAAERLAYYETRAYAERDVTITLELGDGKTSQTPAKVFVWAANHAELEEGLFNLEVYQSTSFF